MGIGLLGYRYGKTSLDFTYVSAAAIHAGTVLLAMLQFDFTTGQDLHTPTRSGSAKQCAGGGCFLSSRCDDVRMRAWVCAAC